MKQQYSVNNNFKMKKSPLSTPSGSKGKKSYNWKSHDHKNRTGYSYVKNDSYQCTSPNGGQRQSGNDFIPLNISTPMPEQIRRHSSNWHGSGGRNHRNLGNSGFNHYRNYHASPKSNFNNSYSPYKLLNKQFYNHKKGYQKDSRKQIDISCYLDMKSFLEDPWAELTKKLSESTETNEDESLKLEQLFSPQSIYVDSEPNSECKSVTNVDNSCFSPETKNESSVDINLGLNDTNISSVSRTESSIDIKFDNVRFSEESKNNSICNNNDNTSENIRDENNINNICISKTDIVQNFT